MDYRRWENLADIDEDEDDRATAANNPSQASKLFEQNHSMVLATSLLWEAAPHLTDDESVLLIRFIATQDRGSAKSNVGCADAICGMLESKATPLPRSALVDLCLLVKERLDAAKDDKAVRAAMGRVLMLVTGALNTVAACDSCKGGAPAFFALLDREPTGAVAARYEGYGFAKECLDAWTTAGGKANATMGKANPAAADLGSASGAAEAGGLAESPWWKIARTTGRQLLLIGAVYVFKQLYGWFQSNGEGADRREL